MFEAEKHSDFNVTAVPFNLSDLPCESDVFHFDEAVNVTLEGNFIISKYYFIVI